MTKQDFIWTNLKIHGGDKTFEFQLEAKFKFMMFFPFGARNSKKSETLLC